MKLTALNKICEMLLTEYPNACVEAGDSTMIVYHNTKHDTILMTISFYDPEKEYSDQENNYTINQGKNE
ncbi:hypothetical protein [Crocosphaera sp.]|uniref:hypothetical protein n=1 Tax=Crocosphaera sp. TaxID=2729996 RepID=UPI002629B289|nr:hypothetical protein [Crocosphaera sp.]MDJ0579039.1 hypothetical protein [Crocosphaera sp.]